ncbi:MAG: Ig-like domain-containing protein, partial [Nitrososphaerales archaeon]
MKNLNLSLIILSFGVINTLLIPLPVFAPTNTCQGVPTTIIGTSGHDVITGTQGNDVIVGLEGNDSINAMGGDDLVCGDAGNDTLIGGAGIDNLNAGDGNDGILGGAGNDVISGDAGNDSMSGDLGSDTMLGGVGDDRLLGGANDDTLYGGDGNDSIDGGSGNDSVDGGSGNDNCVTVESIANCEPSNSEIDPPHDTTAPTVSIASPLSGQTLTGTISISADAADDTGVVRVEFYVDGQLIATDTTNTFATSWNTNAVPDGSHRLSGKAYDLAGNVGTTSDTGVIINNVPIVPDQHEGVTCQGVPATIIGTEGKNTLRGTSGND